MGDPTRVRIGKLRELLNEWDFIGVREFSVGDDEYDCLLSPLLTRLVGGANADEVASYLRGEIRDHFGWTPSRSTLSDS